MHEDVPYHPDPGVEADCPRCEQECDVWAIEPSVVIYCEHCQELFHCGVTWADMDETDHLEE